MRYVVVRIYTSREKTFLGYMNVHKKEFIDCKTFREAVELFSILSKEEVKNGSFILDRAINNNKRQITMKARRKGDTAPFEDVYKIVIGRGLYAKPIPINDVEFEQENKPISNNTDAHWLDARERAAIAAMQGTITILGSSDRTAFRDIIVEGYKGSKRTYPNEIAEFAVACADALVEQLKKEKKL